MLCPCWHLSYKWIHCHQTLQGKVFLLLTSLSCTDQYKFSDAPLEIHCTAWQACLSRINSVSAVLPFLLAPFDRHVAQGSLLYYGTCRIAFLVFRVSFKCSLGTAAEWKLLIPALLASCSLRAAQAWLGYIPPPLQDQASMLILQLDEGKLSCTPRLWRLLQQFSLICSCRLSADFSMPCQSCEEQRRFCLAISAARFSSLACGLLIRVVSDHI